MSCYNSNFEIWEPNDLFFNVAGYFAISTIYVLIDDRP